MGSDDKKIIDSDNIFQLVMLAKTAGLFENVRIGKTLGNKTYLTGNIIELDSFGLGIFFDSAMNAGPSVNYKVFKNKKGPKFYIDIAATTNMKELYDRLRGEGIGVYRPKFKLSLGVSLTF